MSQKDVLRTVDTVTDEIVSVTSTVRNRKGIPVTPDVLKRQNIEYAILRRFVIDAIKAGYSIDVDNGGDEPDLAGSTSVKAVLKAAMETDDEHLILHKDGKRIGWVYFVYGNDGWDVINDYVDNPAMDALMAGALALAERYEERAR